MNIEILVDSGGFWDRLSADLASARDRAWVQTLSFEGDRAGQALAEAMIACPAKDRRILIDDYTRFWLSDRFLYSFKGLRDRELQDERRATKAMIQALHAGGVDTRFVSPMGFLFRRLAARDHKKIMLIDADVAYIGGINFSEHNFEWHDMMLRIEHPGIAQFLQNDVTATWNGRSSPAHASFDGLELLSLDGVDNERTLSGVLELMAGAERSVVVHNAYITFPFVNALRSAVERGVRVTVITAEVNNRMFMRDYMLWEGARSGFELLLYPGRMSHLKAVLIDDRTLITGSSNFDWLTYTYQPEILAVIDRPEVIAAFKGSLLEPDLEICRPADVPVDERVARKAYRVMRLFSRIGRFLCPPVRKPGWKELRGRPVPAFRVGRPALR